MRQESKLRHRNVPALPSIGAHEQLRLFPNGLIQSKLKDKIRLASGPRNGAKINTIYHIFKIVQLQNKLLIKYKFETRP